MFFVAFKKQIDLFIREWEGQTRVLQQKIIKFSTNLIKNPIWEVILFVLYVAPILGDASQEVSNC